MQSTIRLVVPVGAAQTRHFWYGLLVTFALWHHRARSRRHLAALDDRALDDVGLSRDARRIECAKRFWQA